MKLNLKRLKAIIEKEFLHIKRDPRSLAITILAPVILLVLYAYAITFDIKKIDMGVIDYDKTSLSRNYIDKFISSGYFVIKDKEKDIKEQIKNLRVNKIRVLLVIPQNFTFKIRKNKTADVQVILDGSDSNTANVALGYIKIITATFSKNILLKEVKSRGFNPKRIPYIEPVPRVWYNPQLKSQNFVIPGLIAIIMMLIAATLTSLTIVREKESGSFEQIISTPAKSEEILIGKLLPYILIGFIDVLIIFLVGTLWFKVPFRGDFFTFLVFTLFFLLGSMGLGLFMSSIAPNQTVAVIGTVFATVLPSILLSGFVFPLDSMPVFISVFSYLVPARYFLVALRSLFLKPDVYFLVLLPEAVFLCIFSFLFIFISIKKFKKFMD
jgi:ABC-2 type transport system permease protein